jgi:steroid delta-isomerase-like uncharacterized protein
MDLVIRMKRLLMIIASGAACLSLLLIGVPPGEARTALERSRADEIGQGWCDAWNSHDVSRVLRVFTDDVFYEDVTFGLTVHGSGELRNFAEFFFTAVPDLHLQCTTTFVTGRHGSIEWIFSGTDVGVFKTGKRFSVRGGSVIEVRGDKISRNSDYYDSVAIMRQVGVLN